LVNALRERNIEFVSVVPGDLIPPEAKVVMTTENERQLISYDKVLAFDDETDLNTVIGEAVKILQGKESYGKIIIGVDPGEAFGLAVIADGKVNETRNCFSVQEVASEISNIIKNVNVTSTAVSIKIGNGVPIYKDLLNILDSHLSPEVVLEVVNEVGTDRLLNHDKHRRVLRHIASAIRIAGRTGYVYSRGKTDEVYS
jgi:hypothetical protein